MPTFLALSAGFGVHRTQDLLEIQFPGASPGLSFQHAGRLVRAQLTFGGNRMRIDVSLQPGVVVRTVDQAAREDGADPNGWRAVLVRELRQWAVEATGHEPPADDLAACVGALTHPLLAQLYQHRRTPLWEVPRWAAPTLQQPDAPAAAAWLLGEGNRRVARSLASGFLAAADGQVHLGGLALAVIGKDLLSPDSIANVLDAAAAVPPGPLPDVDDVRAIRQALPLLPERRRAALLCDVATHHDIPALTEVMTQLWWVRDKVDLPLPQRLEQLRDVCRHHVTVLAHVERPVAPAAAHEPARARAARPRQVAAPTPPPQEPPPPPPPAPRAERPPTPRRAHHEQPRPAPRVAHPGPVPDRWSVPADLMPMHLLRHEGLRYVVPTTAVELRSWGSQLHNCLSSYGAVAAGHHTWLIGIERDGALIGCIEVVPTSRVVRQALGSRNAPLAPDVMSASMRAMRRTGVVPG